MAEPVQVVPVDVAIEVRYSGPLVGDRSVQERFSQQLTLIGSGETRVVTMESFTLQRTATVSVTPQDGDFTVSTGAMDLRGVVGVRLGSVEQQGSVTLTTENASSPSGRYAANGSRLDPGTLVMVLVGGGAVVVTVLGQDLTYEYFIMATCVLATRPEASDRG